MINEKELQLLVNQLKEVGLNQKSEFVFGSLYRITSSLRMNEPELAKLLIMIKQKRVDCTKSDAVKNRVNAQIGAIIQFYKDNFNVDLSTYQLAYDPKS